MGHLGDLNPGLGRVVMVQRQEGEARGVRSGLGQLEVRVGGHRGEELVGYLGQDPRAVTGVPLGSGGAAVSQVFENGQRLAHQLMAPAPLQIGHQAHAAGVVLECGVVEAAGSGWAAPVRWNHGRPLRLEAGGVALSGPGNGNAGRDDAGPSAVQRSYTSATAWRRALFPGRSAWREAPVFHDDGVTGR